jgi:dihydrodipicolinate synthase/N-acetylneuraminate lyase
MNQVGTFCCTTTRRNGLLIPAPVTPDTEDGKVQFTATAPAAVLLLHEDADVVAT